MRRLLALSIVVFGCGRFAFDAPSDGEARGDGRVAPEDWTPTAPSTPFVRLMGSPDFDWGWSVAALPSGDVLLSGIAYAALTLGGSTIGGSGQVLIAARYTPDGAHEWSVGASATYVADGRVAIAGSGDGRIAGHFSGTATFGTTTIDSPNGQSFVVLDVSPTGVLTPLAYAGAPSGGNVQGYALAEAADGRRAVGGVYGAGALVVGSITTPQPSDTDDGYLVIYDASGMPTIAHAFSSASTTYITSAAFDGLGNLCAVGIASGPLTIDGSVVATPSGSEAGIVAVIGTDGQVKSQQLVDASSSAFLTSVVGLPTGGFVLAGPASGTVTLGAKTVTTTSPDFVVARIDADGTPRWLRAYGGDGLDGNTYVAVSPNGELVVASAFAGTITLGTTTLTSVGNHDLLVAVLATDDGVAKRAWREGADGDEVPTAVAVDYASGDAVVSGTFSGDTMMRGMTATSQQFDIFLLRMSPL